MAQKPPIFKADFLEALIRSGYLPEEIPPIVTAKFFSNHCKSNYSHWDSHQSSLLKLNTEYDTFSVPRATTGRRILSLVNPIAQLGLSLIITRNRTAIKKKMSRSSISLYETDEKIKDGKAFKGLNFNKWHDLQDEISSKYPYAVKVDISRFFYTIYTHSIPWSIFGKSKAKRSYREGWFKAHWSNQIDMALQACQSRETFGIPVGPDTSRIVSEILMSGIEEESRYLRKMNFTNAVRLIDDFYIGENSRVGAQKTLDDLETALWRYNLETNQEKTFISETKYIYDDYWKRDFDDHKVYDNNVTDKKKIKRYVDAALYHCEKERSELPAIWACRRLISISKSITDSVSLVDAFFRLGRDYPSTTKHVAEFLVNNRSRLSEKDISERIEYWIKNLIAYNYGTKNDLELSWVLLIAGIFRVILEKDDFPDFDNAPSSIVFSILGLLRQHGLLNVPLSSWNWRSRFKSGGIHGPDWLPLYEAVLRKWTTDKKLVALVNSCPHFSKLLADDVSFLDDNILKISKIDFRRRKIQLSDSPKSATDYGDRNVVSWFNRTSNYT